MWEVMRPFDELLPCATRNIKHSAQAQCVIVVLSSVTKTIICEALREPSPDAWDREPGTCVTIASPQSPSLSRRRRQWEGGREGGRGRKSLAARPSLHLLGPHLTVMNGRSRFKPSSSHWSTHVHRTQMWWWWRSEGQLSLNTTTRRQW